MISSFRALLSMNIGRLSTKFFGVLKNTIYTSDPRSASLSSPTSTTLDWSLAPARFPWTQSRYKLLEIRPHSQNSKKSEVSLGSLISIDTLSKTSPKYAGRFTTSPRRMFPLFGAPLNRLLLKHSRPPSLLNQFWLFGAQIVLQESKSMPQDMLPVE
jgi:hypothetical protein